ncbi:MAG TPA: alpha/beta hydrolase [Actinomycetes bacterium]
MTDARSVLAWQLDIAQSRAASLQLLAADTETVQRRVGQGVLPFMSGRSWRGPGAAAALRVLHRRAQVLTRIAADLSSAARLLVDGFARLGRLQVLVQHAVRCAADDRRAVTLPAVLAAGGGPLAWAAIDLLDRRTDAPVDAVVAEVTHVDRGCAHSLAELDASARSLLRLSEPDAARQDALAELGAAGFARWLAAPPPRSSTPAQVADWWSAHTPAEQRALASDPRTWARLGSLDGLPFGVRDKVNRSALQRRLDGYELALGQIQARLDHAVIADAGSVQELMRLRAELVSGHRVDLTVSQQLSTLAQQRDPITHRSLLVQLILDEPEEWEGRGRVSVALGDVDSASHVAYLVPGLGVRPDPDLADLVGDAHHVYEAARALAPSTATAVIAWLGYETPGWAQVAFDGRARAGGGLLATDVGGLRAARTGGQPQVTVIGHSYGSTTASVAVQAATIDDAIFVGSPGLLVGHAGELPVGSSHVWVGAASGDEVSRLSRFGTDPAAAAFGGQRFAAESPPGTPTMAQHLRYFDPGSESLPNIARIVVGEQSLVTTVAGRIDRGLAGVVVDSVLPMAALPVLPPLAAQAVRRLDPALADPAHGDSR